MSERTEGPAGVAWVAVPAEWLHCQDAATYLTSGGRGMGPVLAVAEAAPGEPAELATLPAEVRHLVHCVDRVRHNWAEGNAEVRERLWRELHAASDGVWNRPMVTR